MKLYKLTTPRLQTHNGCQWEVGVWKTTNGLGELCGSGWLHAYTDPLLACLLNPIHANLSEFRLWEAEGGGNRKDDNGLKCGVTRLRIVRELDVPAISTGDRVRFAILCALEVYKETGFVAWANGWLDGTDRSEKAAAEAAARAARAAEAAAARARAAEAAARAARAAEAAAEAAWAAWAARAAEPLDLIALARRACAATLKSWPHTQEIYGDSITVKK